MKWDVVLEKVTENALCPAIARRHVRRIAAAAERNARLGFKARVGKLGQPEEVLEGHLVRKRYRVRVRLEEGAARSPEVAEERFSHVRKVMEKCATALRWKLSAGAGGEEVTQGSQGEGDEAVPDERPRTPFRPADLSCVSLLRQHFADVYERDAHLRLINDAVQTYVATGGEVRAHTLLYGEPGGCKSTILERLKPLYDDDFERMVFLDSTTMTKAGLERWLLRRAEAKALPEVIVFEEIEKVDNKDNLKCLGSVLASGYLMRTNAVDGRVQVPCRFLAMATCNDVEALRGFMKGFIFDRFTNQFRCTLPSREVMYRILLDKVAAMSGNPSWAAKAMELGDAMGVRTPRKLIGFLAGRHRLETGEYQRDQLEVEKKGAAEVVSLEGVA